MTLPSSPDTVRRRAFFPTAESARACAREDRRELPARATETAPIFDPRSSTAPLLAYDPDLLRKSFHAHTDDPAIDCSIPPPRPADFDDAYLAPMLTRNECLRLVMLWYYARDVPEDEELLHRIQDKVDLVKEFLGWDSALAGLIYNDVYESIGTAGFPSIRLPRRETMCGHTIQQKPGVRRMRFWAMQQTRSLTRP